ncbi:MAG: diphosphatase, partial [Actinotalea sp.]|nr:diphosphatase [Actinotalea sp.]
MDWTRLPLARATVDRAAHRRSDPDLVAAAWADPSTRVVLLTDGRVATREPVGGSVQLDLRSPAELARITPRAAGGQVEALVVFLGEDAAASEDVADQDAAAEDLAGGEDPADEDAATDECAARRGTPARYLALVVPGPPNGAPDLDGFPAHEWIDPPVRWATLREVGDALGDRDAGLAVSAVGLSAWHDRHPRCPLCGAATTAVQAGWVRRCTADGSDHYPRTDPAVIMAVTDVDGRLLLGHGAAWPDARFSTLAGYVEPGESLEGAVRREVAEEAGVVVGEVTYRGSQPWPFPASLMLAFTARAETTEVVVDGVELTEARWF